MDSVSDNCEDGLEMKDLGATVEEDKDDDYFQDLSNIGIFYYVVVKCLLSPLHDLYLFHCSE